MSLIHGSCVWAGICWVCKMWLSDVFPYSALLEHKCVNLDLENRLMENHTFLINGMFRFKYVHRDVRWILLCDLWTHCLETPKGATLVGLWGSVGHSLKKKKKQLRGCPSPRVSSYSGMHIITFLFSCINGFNSTLWKHEASMVRKTWVAALNAVLFWNFQSLLSCIPFSFTH